jgi:hypothetical protein
MAVVVGDIMVVEQVEGEAMAGREDTMVRMVCWIYDQKERIDTPADDDEGDRPRRDDYRPQRRRYGEEPPSVRVRKQILGIAESVSMNILGQRMAR